MVAPVERPVRPRAAFEAWISGPPYEREIERFGDGSAWPGNYRELDVDLAWCAWSAAMAATRDRCAALCDAEAQAREQAAHKTHGSGSPVNGMQTRRPGEKEHEVTTESNPGALGSNAQLGPLLEDALRRAYYYTDTGAWRGPLTEEADRWRAVATVAAERLLAERERTLRATAAMSIAAGCIAAAYKDDWPAFDRLADDFDDAVSDVRELCGPNAKLNGTQRP